jgi:hypothetical protein
MADGKRDEKQTAPDKADDKDKPVPPAMPAAGPHARPELTNEDATPGTGLLPPAEAGEGEADPGGG